MEEDEGFDVIVVGAGSAGCATAARLAADPSCRVLLLEAGTKTAQTCSTAAQQKLWLRCSYSQRGAAFKALTYGLRTEPQEGLCGRAVPAIAGRGLGGSGLVNAGWVNLGHAEEYAEWEGLGVAGWGPEELQRHFDAARPLAAPTATGRLGAAFLAASLQALPATPEPDGHARWDQPGVRTKFFSQWDPDSGRRRDPYTYLVQPVLKKGHGNLVVRTGATVCRVEVAGSRAVGVVVQDSPGGPPHTYRIRPHGEVVVCAGAYGSPRVLQASGIGPHQVLQAAGVATVLDSPAVGRNLVDTPVCPLVLRNRAGREPHPAENSIQACLTYTSSVAAARGDSVPDMEVLVLEGTHGGGDVAPYSLSLPWQQPARFLSRCVASLIVGATAFISGCCGCCMKPVLEQTIIFFVCQHSPRSTGTVQITSSDPFRPPAVDPQLLSAQPDVDSMREGLARLHQIVTASPFAPHRGPEIHPGPRYGRLFPSGPPSERFLRENTVTHSHPSGTCRMGPGADVSILSTSPTSAAVMPKVQAMAARGFSNPEVGSVVDEELRVHGLQGLRVADASIVPRNVRCPMSALCMAIGHKAGEMVLRDVCSRRLQAQTRSQTVQGYLNPLMAGPR